MSSLAQIFDQYRDEFQVNADGTASITVRGLARLLGVSDTAIRKLIQKLQTNQPPQGLEHAATLASGVQTNSGIPDKLAGLIAQYYAGKGYEQAQQLAAALISTSFRALIRQQLGYQMEPAAPSSTGQDERLLDKRIRAAEAEERLAKLRDGIYATCSHTRAKAALEGKIPELPPSNTEPEQYVVDLQGREIGNSEQADSVASVLRRLDLKDNKPNRRWIKAELKQAFGIDLDGGEGAATVYRVQQGAGIPRECTEQAIAHLLAKIHRREPNLFEGQLRRQPQLPHETWEEN